MVFYRSRVDAAVAALVGAGVGALVPGVVTSWSALLQNRRAREAQQDARDARLFEHRRSAYAEFIGICNAVALRYNRHHMEGVPVDETGDPLRVVINQASMVQVYGTKESAQAATAAWVALSKYVHGGASDSGLVFDFQVLLDHFTDVARADLGVPGQVGVSAQLAAEVAARAGRRDGSKP